MDATPEVPLRKYPSGAYAQQRPTRLTPRSFMKMLTFSKKVTPVGAVRRCEAQPLADRIQKYVEKMPQAVSGSGRAKYLSAPWDTGGGKNGS
jgi:hypothetical protein